MNNLKVVSLGFLLFGLFILLISYIDDWQKEESKTKLCKALEKEFNFIYNIYEYQINDRILYCNLKHCIIYPAYGKYNLFKLDFLNNLTGIVTSTKTDFCIENIYNKYRYKSIEEKEYESYLMEAKQ